MYCTAMILGISKAHNLTTLVRRAGYSRPSSSASPTVTNAAEGTLTVWSQCGGLFTFGD